MRFVSIWSAERLLDELLHRAVAGEAHEAVGRGVLDRRQRERAARARRLVLGDLGGQVDVGQDVAVEHEEALVEQLLGELQRAGGAERAGSST